MAFYPTLAIEQQFSGSGGAWTDITGDVLADVPIELQYGIQGAGLLDQLASTGTLRYALSNSAANSATTLGYYSPAHASKRSGFDLRIGTRIRLTYGGTPYCKFTGWLDQIEPEAGLYGTRRTHCVAVDWMDVAANFRLNLETQTNKDADDLILLIQAMARPQPAGVDLDDGDSNFPYCFDNGPQERQTALMAFGAILRSEGPPAKLFLRGDASNGGVLEFQNRSARFSPGAAAATFDDDMVHLRPIYRSSDLINRVKAVAHPRAVDAAATTTLYAMQQPQTSAIPAGESRTFTVPYTDPALRASRVGGMSMVAPVANTHYTMNTAADGTGTDLTASFTVTATYGANSVDYVVTNNHATLAGYITKLEAKGKGIYDYQPVMADREDSTSITTYTEHLFQIDMPYQSDPNVAQTVADLILMVYKVPRPHEVEMTYCANISDAFMAAACSLEPGDVISVNETVTGIGLTYWINSVSMRIDRGALGPIIWVTYLLELSPSEGYWYLGLTGHSELGSTTYLGP